MNQEASEFNRNLDADKLPVLHKERNPKFSKETVHVMFVLGIVRFWMASNCRWTRDREGHAMR